MKLKFFLFSLVSVSLSLTSCNDSLTEANTQGNISHLLSEKIVNTSEFASKSSLLVKFASAPTDAIQTELLEKGVIRVEKLFPSMPGKEDMEARFGLDKWYVLSLTAGLNINTVATEIAAFSSVTTVEFNDQYVNAESDVCFPVPTERENAAPIPATRAVSYPFNDPLLYLQWGYVNVGDVSFANDCYAGADINVLDVWKELSTGDPDIIVAVVDEGVKYNHPDLAANMWYNEAERFGQPGVDDDGNGYVDDIYGYNFVADGEITWNKEKDSGHGTHCAGTIAAVNNNNLGVSGVAGGSGNNDGCRIMSCQIFDGKTGGSSEIVSRAIKYAADMGASIISCSFGYPGGTYKSDAAYRKGNWGSNQVEYDALAYFEATKNNSVVDGGIPIFASGNDGDPYATYPGALQNIISVSAFGPDYLPAYYSNYGPGCNIVAPGGEYYHKAQNNYPVEALILSTYPSELGDNWTVRNRDYAYMQGTSMACPHVSGVAALGLSYAKKLGKTFSTSKFKELLLSSANDFDSRLMGTKSLYQRTMNLGDYRKQMGTGSIDAHIFMMQIEGIPCLVAETGRNQWIDVSQYFGTSSVNLTYLGEPTADGKGVYCEISDNDRKSLGLEEEPYMMYGKLYIHPTKMGSGRVRIRAIAGGSIIGGDDAIGGMEMTQEVAIISRSFKSKNGGWL
ncbi:MAG: S8 family serine peptidase [Bacteroidaceae bacterium]|nr:S8 family serine peptidase [Bacteroidaceae bacterium]